MPDERDPAVPVEMTLILSTARTGTKFFETYINRTCEDMLCAHEPRPSRRFKFLSNLFLQGKLGENPVWRAYRHARESLWNSLGGRRYVESNNFLFGCVPALRSHIPGLQLVHIVRHPVDYAISHLRHGFWSGLKGFTARHVPYWLEALDLRGSARDDPAQVLAARWNYVNRTIGGYGGRYLLLRFEDIFKSAPEMQCASLSRLRAFLECPEIPEALELRLLDHKVNPSSRERGEVYLDNCQKALIEESCSSLMEEYGYRRKHSV
jgi:hypothetical protein